MPAQVNAVAMETVGLVAVPATKTTTFTSAAYDLLDYDGLVGVILSSAKGTGNADNTLSGKIQDCDTSGGTYADVSGATFAQVLGTGGTDVVSEVVLDAKQVRRFIKFVGTIAGTTPSFIFGVTAHGLKKYQ